MPAFPDANPRLLPADAAKVPAATAAFWLIKILATTAGETGGDAVSMSLGLGYATASLIFLAVFVLLLHWQIAAPHFRRWRYWATVVASTTVGTTLADLADRSLGLGYPGGAALLLTLLGLSLLLWKHATGSIAIASVDNARAERLYWLTITCSQTLGTALGDWAADSMALGYTGAAAVFALGLIAVWLLYRRTGVSRTALFWAAFVLTRPLGAALGDWLDKPVDAGGLAFGRGLASMLLIAGIVACVAWLPQRAATTTRH